MAKLTENSNAVFTYLKENGGHVAIDELATALDKSARSISANVTDLQKKGLAVREKVEVEGAEKPITYVNLTPDYEAAFEALADKD